MYTLCVTTLPAHRWNRPKCTLKCEFLAGKLAGMYLTAWETHTGCCNFRYSSFVPLFSDTVHTLGELLPICPHLLTHLLAYSMSYVSTYTEVQREVNHSFYPLVYRNVSYLLSSSVQMCIISSILNCTDVYHILYPLYSSVQKCIISSIFQYAE